MKKRKLTKIHIERARYGLTQAELAKKINTSRQTIHSIETGKNTASCLLALKIAKVFNCSVEYLFTKNN